MFEGKKIKHVQELLARRNNREADTYLKSMRFNEVKSIYNKVCKGDAITASFIEANTKNKKEAKKNMIAKIIVKLK